MKTVISNILGIIKILAIVFLVISYIGSSQQKNFWKERCIDTTIWADSLYSENLRLTDTIRVLRIKNR